MDLSQDRLRDDDYGLDIWGPQRIRIEFLGGKLRGTWPFGIETYCYVDSQLCFKRIWLRKVHCFCDCG